MQEMPIQNTFFCCVSIFYGGLLIHSWLVCSHLMIYICLILAGLAAFGYSCAEYIPRRESVVNKESAQ